MTWSWNWGEKGLIEQSESRVHLVCSRSTHERVSRILVWQVDEAGGAVDVIRMPSRRLENHKSSAKASLIHQPPSQWSASCMFICMNIQSN